MLPQLMALAVLTSVLVIPSDLYARRVPNACLLASLICGSGLILAAWVQGTGEPPWLALLGLFAGLAALLPFHAFGYMGAGDVKFFALLGFLLGAKALIPIWIIGSLIAGAHAATILLSRHWLIHTIPSWAPMQTWFSTSTIGQRIVSARKGRQGLPYAAYLGIGALITVFNPELMHW